MSTIKSAYIHIPFCSSICSYCDFCKMFYNERLVDSYLDSLEKEIKLNYKGEELDTLYIGGGTPSSLNLDQLTRLFDIIKLFKLSSSCEFTIEVNVSDITKEKLFLFKCNNINRISIGIETVNKKFSSFINRDIDYEMFIEKINLTKEYFDNINVDLMYAFPSETLTDLDNDLAFIKNIDVSHISIYSLIIEEHTKIYIDKINPIDEELESKMYYKIVDYLKSLGYVHYEISNFGKEKCFSRHNLVYWNNMEYYGFGLGASGYVGNIRYTNTRSINNYLKGDFIYIKEEIDKNISMENEMIFGLRKIAGVNKKLFFEKYGFNVEQIFDIMDLLDKKLLIDDKEYLFIPEDKLYVSNSILINFIGGSNNGK